MGKGAVSRINKRRCSGCSKELSRGTEGDFCAKCRYHPPGTKVKCTGDELHVSNVSFIHTLEELIRVAEIDTTVWSVRDFTANAWGQHSVEDGDQQLFQVKARFQRVVPDYVEAALELLERRVGSKAPQYKPARQRRARDPVLAVFCPFDVHFGKLAWRWEVGADYDLAIAEQVFAGAVDITTRRARAAGDVAQWLLPVGQDLLHVDSWKGETTLGTQVEHDSRLPKIHATACMALVRAIERMAEIAPVLVKYSGGNHDRTASWHATEFLRAWFRKHPRVTVDSAPERMWVYEYGVNLIGVAHAELERRHELPLLMATRWPEKWGRTGEHVMLTGHQHRKRALVTTSVDTHTGVTVWTVPSLSGTDAWHYERGYEGGKRAAETYLFSKELGYAGHLVAPAPELPAKEAA